MYEKERVCIVEGNDLFSLDDAVSALGSAFARPMLALDPQSDGWFIRDLGHEIMKWNGIKPLIATLGGTDTREHEYGDTTVYVFNVP